MRTPTRSICPFYGRSCMETYGSHTEFHSPCYHGLDAFTNFLPQRRRHVYLFVDHRHDIVCTHGPPRGSVFLECTAQAFDRSTSPELVLVEFIFRTIPLGPGQRARSQNDIVRVHVYPAYLVV